MIGDGHREPPDGSETVTVLVTAAGAAPAQAFIRGLRSQSELAVRLVGIDTVAHAAGLFDCDARYTVPRVEDPEFWPAIEAICRAQAVDVAVPIADFELDAFAEAAPRLSSELGVTVITNSVATVALARDKRASAQCVAAAGVAVPAIHAPATLSDGDFPVIVKPTSGAGSQGVSVVNHREQLEPALRLAEPEPLVQEFIDGQEYTVDLVVAPDGAVMATAPRIRLEVRAGQSYKGVTVDDAEVEAAARTCVRALGLTGQGNVQLIKSTRDGRCYFVEVNPKFAAAMGLTIGAGLNIPLVYLKLAVGAPVADHDLRRAAGMWLLRSWDDRVVSDAEVRAVMPWDVAPAAPGSGRPTTGIGR